MEYHNQHFTKKHRNQNFTMEYQYFTKKIYETKDTCLAKKSISSEKNNNSQFCFWKQLRFK